MSTWTPSTPLDFDVSPYTGWTRAHYVELAELMLKSAFAHGSEGHARVLFPGKSGGYGQDVDALEGFTRTFMIAAFRLAGMAPDEVDTLGIAQWYAKGFASGTDPKSPERWVRPSEHGQAKVEAATIAFGLFMTKDRIWNSLTPAVQQNIVAYLSEIIGDNDFPANNWLWFRIVVQQFLASVGAPYSTQDIEQDLALHDSFLRADGWYSDGHSRGYDHYTGWALQLYPVIWRHMLTPAELEQHADRLATYSAHLDRFLEDYADLVGGDGAPLAQGRSLVYRFAAAAPFWVGAHANSPTLSPGLIRRASTGIIKHFVDHGAPTTDGILNLGWHHEWREMAQNYSGTGSPFWAAKGFYGLALPADHPAWTEEEQPLPVEQADTARVITAPGWLVSGTQEDGIVRVINHGTDHANQGDLVTDSPLYARFGYSTVTFPNLRRSDLENPLDQSSVLLDGKAATHRTGFTTLELGSAADTTGNTVLYGASEAQSKWIIPDPNAPDHGSGRSGQVTLGPKITTNSVVKGPWEVRATLVAPHHSAHPLRVGGWPVSLGTEQAIPQGAAAVSDRVGGAIFALQGLEQAGVDVGTDVDPLGAHTATAWLGTEVVQPDRWYVCALWLGKPDVPVAAPKILQIPDQGQAGTLEIQWPDGATSSTQLQK